MAGRDDERTRTTPPDESEGFLGRWSRRKADARTAAVSPAALDDAEPEEILSETPEAEDPPPFDVASLPDIDSLGPGSDFSVFMQAGVPAELKTKALRKLWRVKSELANLDGLIDYGEDLTGSFQVVDHLKTAYEVGRGFLKEDEGVKDDQDGAPAEDAEDNVVGHDAGTGDPASAEGVIEDAPEGDADERETAAVRPGKDDPTGS